MLMKFNAGNSECVKHCAGILCLLVMTRLCVSHDNGQPEKPAEKSVDVDENLVDLPIVSESSDNSESPDLQVNSSHDKSDSNVDTTAIHALQLYRRLFRQKRASHIEAVKKILSLGSADKQQKMLQIIFGKIFAVLKEARIKLMEASFTPGDFPSEESVLDVFSIVLENTAFLGDLVLRLPDAAHSLIDTNSDWKSLSTWAVAFSNDTRVFIDRDAEHLSLMAQELEIIEKHPSYVNPYKRETIVSQVVDAEVERMLAQEKRKLKQKEKRDQKKKSKGPRMSTQRHTEF